MEKSVGRSHERSAFGSRPQQQQQQSSSSNNPPSAKVAYLNLARRSDRRRSCEALLEAAGLSAVTERVEALDGAELWRQGQLARRCEGAVTQRALGDEAMSEGWVMGGDLTPGAAALCATTLGLLRRHADCAQPLLVLEDDVDLAPGVEATAVRDLLALLARDGDGDDDGGRAARALAWDVLLLGSHPESELLEVVAPLPQALGGSMCRIGTFFGAFAYVLRARAAGRLAAAIFPCDNQLDSAMSDAADAGALRILHVGTSLLASPKSAPGATDIQRMDEESFVRMTRARLLAEGQIDAAIADHPGITQQLTDAYARQFKT